MTNFNALLWMKSFLRFLFTASYYWNIFHGTSSGWYEITTNFKQLWSLQFSRQSIEILLGLLFKISFLFHLRRNSCFEYLLLQKCKQKPLRWCQLMYKKISASKCSTKNCEFFSSGSFLSLCAKCLQRHCLPLFRLLIEYLWQGSEHLNLNIDIILASVTRALSLFHTVLFFFYWRQ